MLSMVVQELYTDEQLAQRISEGDQQALELLFKKYYTQLVRFAREILKNKEQAEDMVQEVFFKLWDKRESLHISTAVKSYVFVAVKNHCFNQLKQNERKYWMSEDMEDSLHISTNDIVNQISAKALDQKIQEAIAALPPKCSLVFKMSRFEQKSYQEIADALELSIKTVENHIGKALAILREDLKPYMRNLYVLLFALFIS